MKTKLRNSVLAIAAALSLAAPGMANAAYFVLPTPDNNPNAYYGTYSDAYGNDRPAILMDGIPIALKYDDFWSYSAKILDSIQTVNPSWLPVSDFGTYDFSTGTGNILVNLSSVAGGATNPDGIQDLIDLTGGGNTISGWVAEWGGDPQTLKVYQDGNVLTDSYAKPVGDCGNDCVETTTTVGELLALLQSINPEWTIPVLYADYNQTGVGDSLFMSAQIQIIDPSTGPVATWTLDSLSNGVWDQTFPTYNYGEITFEGSAEDCDPAWDPLTGKGCAGVTLSGSTYSASHNKGSGQPDFMAYAPDMDLSLYNSDFLWVASINLGCNPYGLESGLTAATGLATNQGCNTDGYEEFGIAGGVGPTQVPEPHSLALLGLGFAAAGFGMRRRVRS